MGSAFPSRSRVDELFVSHEMVLAWHLLARALHRGAANRAGLPFELVIVVLRHAKLCVPYTRLSVACDDPIVVDSHSADISQKTWFMTQPLTSIDLQRVVMMQLVTESHDDGCASYRNRGYWTWFDVGIATPEGAVLRKVGTRSELRWRSQCNLVTSSAVQSGNTFGIDHEIWSKLREGHTIVVLACSRFSGWSNFASNGRLLFWKSFEPMFM